ncbi:EthD family reductase [Sphingomonas sp. So64.6b]|uniref:EthD family reductase n=1 Tax=Sphingomonas sp. So64.6b TaxID=2997354 RepID=UPI0016045DC1|nr:EthD family reductase [Sphingomonas sp. So64.6b]QNA85440.1 EthD family reductase [Sphingomonas sp. So64.6b]
MIKITVLYPRAAGTWFDFDYYLEKHMPLSIARLGSAMERITVERVTSPGEPYPEPGFHAVCSFVCASRDKFEAAFLPHMAELQGDAPHYTNSQQIVLLNEIEIDFAGLEAQA